MSSFFLQISLALFFATLAFSQQPSSSSDSLHLKALVAHEYSAGVLLLNDFALSLHELDVNGLTHFTDEAMKHGEQIAVANRSVGLNFGNAQLVLLKKESGSGFKEDALKMQRLAIYIAIGWMLLLLFLISVLVRSNRSVKSANKLLAAKNHFIEEQSKELSALNSTKDKLLSIIGHDLRGPLNSLRGMIDLLNKSTLTQEEFILFSKKIKTNVDNVYADLDNLLSWAQSQQNGLKPTIVELGLHHVIKEKVDLLAESSSVKAITVHVDVIQDLSVRGDKNQLGLIIRNLVSNAIKFSHEGGQVTIGAIKKKDQVEISVADKGVGIAEADLETLFRVGVNFSKLGTNNEKGVGLGLLLVKEFVELNRGTIYVTSKLGEGSTFTFLLPAIV
ncbi:MAG: HAMP domain-containing sensor histidine kinase [Cyclobacteriaceae bacterium]|nr:HAMP domain-containing sensor histidine kinase [Cyclobacteriaceae bacterium]